MNNNGTDVNKFPKQDKDSNQIDKKVKNDIDSKKFGWRFGFILSLLPFCFIFVAAYLAQDKNLSTCDAIINACKIAFLDSSIIFVGISLTVTIMNDLNDLGKYISDSKKDRFQKYCIIYIICFASFFTILTCANLNSESREFPIFLRVIIVVGSLIFPYILYKQIYTITTIDK